MVCFVKSLSWTCLSLNNPSLWDPLGKQSQIRYLFSFISCNSSLPYCLYISYHRTMNIIYFTVPLNSGCAYSCFFHSLSDMFKQWQHLFFINLTKKNTYFLVIDYLSCHMHGNICSHFQSQMLTSVCFLYFKLKKQNKRKFKDMKENDWCVDDLGDKNVFFLMISATLSIIKEV